MHHHRVGLRVFKAIKVVAPDTLSMGLKAYFWLFWRTPRAKPLYFFGCLLSPASPGRRFGADARLRPGPRHCHRSPAQNHQRDRNPRPARPQPAQQHGQQNRQGPGRAKHLQCGGCAALHAQHHGAQTLFWRPQRQCGWAQLWCDGAGPCAGVPGWLPDFHLFGAL